MSMTMTRTQLLDESGLLETTVSSEQVYDGYFFHVFHDRVTLPDGAMAVREHMKHPGAVMVMPVFDNGDVLVERQYRYPLRQIFVEFPAGKKDEGEEPLQTGQRELLEETGYTAAEWEHVTDIHNAIAYCDEVIHFYIARGLTKQSEQALDHHEFLQVMRVPFVELEAWMKQGWVPDVKTQLGIFWLKDKLFSNGCGQE
jgi:ADP-ribose pyrophosphatase